MLVRVETHEREQVDDDVAYVFHDTNTPYAASPKGPRVTPQGQETGPP
jgi:hypothetical protein